MWCRRELFKVVEWRDGCVFKTKSLGLVWIDNTVVKSPSDEALAAKNAGGDILSACSSSVKYEDHYSRKEPHGAALIAVGVMR